MSKVSAMQAMREARYAASRTARPAAPAAPAAPARKAAPAKPAGEQRPEALTDVRGDSAVETLLPTDAAAGRPAAATAANGTATTTADVMGADVTGEADAPTEALCGHRSMNNRSCRRPAGHPEKNHRYN